jgi:hypothetical protein
MRLALDADRLARLRDAGDLSDHHTRRPRRVLLDADGYGVRVEIPAPSRLAKYLDLQDVEAFRSGRTILTRPISSSEMPAPVSALDLAEALLHVLHDLPERPDAGRPYLDLRLFAEHSSAATDYARDTVQALRRSLPEAPHPRRTVERRPPLNDAERKRRERARRRAEEEASIAWALAAYLDDEAPEPGSLVPATAVRDYVRDALEYAVEEWRSRVEEPDPRSAEYLLDRAERIAEWRENAEDDGLPPGRPRLPSSRRLYAVAEAHGFQRSRSHGLDRLKIPTTREDTSMTVAEALLDRAARLLLEEARPDLEALLLREEVALAEADNVVPLRRRA